MNHVEQDKAMARMREVLGDMPEEKVEEFLDALRDYVYYVVKEHENYYEHKNSSPF